MSVYILFLMIGTILALIYCAILFASGFSEKNLGKVKPLDDEEYRFKDIYTFGFALISLFKNTKLEHSFSSKSEIKRKKCLSILKGDKYLMYYLNVEYAKRLSLTAPLVILSFIVVPLADEVMIWPLMLLIAVAVYIYIGREPQKKIEARSEMILSQFPEVVSKLALLFNAGLTVSKAWRKVANSGEGEIYNLMRQVCDDMDVGESEIDAYYKFGENSAVPELKKFASTIVQGMTKDGRYLTEMLTDQSSEVWNLKMNMVKRQGDAAVSKLIFPMMIIFVGILIMIIVPIFSNLSI